MKKILSIALLMYASSLTAGVQESRMVLTQNGDFSQYSHFTFFIDADNNPHTGYVNWKIKGADYLVQENGLYRYPKGASGWKWEKVSGVPTVTHTSTLMRSEIPLNLLDVADSINYNASVATADWKRHNIFDAKHLTLSEPPATTQESHMRKVTFTQTPHALKNPLKGFMIWPNDTRSPHTYVSLVKKVIPWNAIENSIDDGVEKIVSYSQQNIYNHFWDNGREYTIAQRNIKAVPIVVLKKSRHDDFSPSDMDIGAHDNQTEEFVKRVQNLVPKLAKAWDNDPHIGFVYMGLVGTWGEQYSTAISPEVAKALGDSFTNYFKNKKVLVRLPHYFNQSYLASHNNTFRGNRYTNYYNFGMYWDAFAWENEMTKGGLDTFDMLQNANFWKEQPILGEVAFNVNYSHIYDQHDYPNLSWPQNDQHAIHDTLTDALALDYLRDYIRATHATALSWISSYNAQNSAEAKSAQVLQKAMGYRFVITDAKFDTVVGDDGILNFSFHVQNRGSAPFYYRWPLEVALLDPDSKKVVFSKVMEDVDIRTWLPGDEWDFVQNRYQKPAQTYTVDGVLNLPENLEEGDYILSIAILDPDSMKPSVKFAVTNYYKGGRTPLGMVGIGQEAQMPLPAYDDVVGDVLAY